MVFCLGWGFFGDRGLKKMTPFSCRRVPTLN